MATAVQRYDRKRFLITFLRRVFCTINTESSQLVHRNDLKIKCKHQLTLKCTTPTPIVLNASPDVTTPSPDRQSLWLDQYQ